MGTFTSTLPHIGAYCWCTSALEPGIQPQAATLMENTVERVVLPHSSCKMCIPVCALPKLGAPYNSVPKTISSWFRGQPYIELFEAHSVQLLLPLLLLLSISILRLVLLPFDCTVPKSLNNSLEGVGGFRLGGRYDCHDKVCWANSIGLTSNSDLHKKSFSLLLLSL